MATRLFSDLLSGGGQRYYYDLEGSPGVVSPGVGAITLNGHEPQYPGIAFRTPATLTLILNGQLVNQDVPLRPAQAALAFTNSTVGLGTVRLIQPTLPSPVENPDNDFVPTLIQIFHKEPAVGVATLIGLPPSVTEGGDIGTRSPATAALSLIGYPYLRTIPPPVDGEIAPLILEGLVPEVITTLLIEPGIGAMLFGTQPATPEGEDPPPPEPPPPPTVDTGFVWIDDAPSPPLLWS
jgi:hypothetical protein